MIFRTDEKFWKVKEEKWRKGELRKCQYKLIEVKISVSDLARMERLLVDIR